MLRPVMTLPGLLAPRDEERPQLEALTCVWCDSVLVGPARPGKRTLALWMNRCCKSCASRYDLVADVPREFVAIKLPSVRI